MIRDAHGVGFRVLVATILPRTNRVFSWTNAQEQQRITYNQLVRNNSGGADAIADLGGDTTIGLNTAPNDPSFSRTRFTPRYLPTRTILNPFTLALCKKRRGREAISRLLIRIRVALPLPIPARTPMVVDW